MQPPTKEHFINNFLTRIFGEKNMENHDLQPVAVGTTADHHLLCESTGELKPIISQEKVVAMIKTCYDPEIPVDIYELGLIYDIKIDSKNAITVTMTLTSPNCPSAAELPREVEEKVRSIAGVTDAYVELTFEPPWDKSMMSEEARFELGMW